MPTPTNIYDNSTSNTITFEGTNVLRKKDMSKRGKYILGAVGVLSTIGITALIAKAYKYFFDKNKNLKDNTDTVSTNV